MRDEPKRVDDLLELIPRSFREREALYSLILAAYRVELTAALHGVAGRRATEEETLLIYDLAGRIADAAGDARLSLIRSEALALKDVASEAHEGSKRAAEQMLVGGLKLIDRILDAARAQRAGSGERAGSALN